ncbi:MAG: PP2C family protein-serine/threonine phosphatase [candidate division KSB1 bacterium]|nr:PP2C family protein-serine/threonine phosphatase [candidate division KSB1 bacterium]
MVIPRRKNLYLAAAGVAGLALFTWTSLRWDPLTAIRLPLKRAEILERAEQIAAAAAGDVEGQGVSVQFLSDRRWLRYLQSRFGVQEAHHWIRAGAPAYRWQVKWNPRLRYFQLGREMPDEQALEMVRSSILGEISVELDPHGHLLSFSRRPSRSDSLRTLPDSARARQMATDFLRLAGVPESALAGLQLRRENRGQPGPPVHVFSLEGASSVPGVTETRWLVVGREGIRSYRTEYSIPRDYAPSPSKLTSLFELTGLLSVVTLALVLLIRRLRADKIDLAQGIPLAALVTVCVAIIAYTSMETPDLYSVMGVAFIVPVVGLAVLVLYALADSVGHDVWPEKVRPVTAVLRGRILVRSVGQDILRGFLWAGIAAGSVRLVDWLYLQFGEGRLLIDPRQPVLASGSPFVLHLCAATSLAVLRELTFRALVVSYFRRFVVASLPLLFLGSVTGLFDFIGLGLGETEPGLTQFLRQGVFAAAMTGSLLSGSFLVPVVAAWVVALLHKSLALWAAGLSLSGIAGFACLGLLLGFGIVVRARGMPASTLDALEPAYVSRVAERERLQRELEIARSVQQGFLPANLPQVPGLDLASRCVPATEVGGDYYDVFLLDSHRLGVAVGDVSGKGIGAAFYMTLAKGFLRACTQQSDSPREVLIRVNQLFCENAERGRFISMIYAVFDLRQRVLSFARAGHNPLLLRRLRAGEVESFAPSGMALGLARSSLFSEVTVEERIPFAPGDVFVFYTDGFTEAMTLEEVEFGEERLAEALRTTDSAGTAQEILDHLFRAVTGFVGSGKQHDDMTLVVVKAI